jgi:hypothetical protein
VLYPRTFHSRRYENLTTNISLALLRLTTKTAENFQKRKRVCDTTLTNPLLRTSYLSVLPYDCGRTGSLKTTTSDDSRYMRFSYLRFRISAVTFF